MREMQREAATTAELHLLVEETMKTMPQKEEPRSAGGRGGEGRAGKSEREPLRRAT